MLVTGTDSGEEIGLSHRRTHCELVWACISVTELLPRIYEETLGPINSMRIVWVASGQAQRKQGRCMVWRRCLARALGCEEKFAGVEEKNIVPSRETTWEKRPRALVSLDLWGRGKSGRS